MATANVSKSKSKGTVKAKAAKAKAKTARLVRQIIWQSGNTIRSEERQDMTIVLRGPSLKSGSKFQFEQVDNDTARDTRKGMTALTEKEIPSYDLLFMTGSKSLGTKAQVTYVGSFQGQGTGFERSIAKSLGVEHTQLGAALKGKTLLAVTVKTARVGTQDGKTVVVSNPRFAYVREGNAKVEDKS